VSRRGVGESGKDDLVSGVSGTVPWSALGTHGLESHARPVARVDRRRLQTLPTRPPIRSSSSTDSEASRAGARPLQLNSPTAPGVDPKSIPSATVRKSRPSDSAGGFRAPNDNSKVCTLFFSGYLDLWAAAFAVQKLFDILQTVRNSASYATRLTVGTLTSFHSVVRKIRSASRASGTDCQRIA
jgi:hypothetical protein